MFTTPPPRARRGVARAAGGDVDRLQDLDEVLAGVADARAAAAAGAEHLAELERVDRELVVDALAVANVLVVARVVAAGVQRERRRLAGVPAAPPGPAADPLLLVDDVEAVAGGADARTGAAAVAARSASCESSGSSKCVSIQSRTLSASISRLAATRCACGRALVVGLAAERVGLDVAGEARLVRLDQGAPLVGRRLVHVAAGDRREQAVGALDVVRRRADGGAEAAVVDHRAGEVDDGGRLAAAVPELVLVVPVHDLVDDLEGGGVAGLGRQHDARSELGRDFLDLDGGALLLPAAERLVLGQEVALERELRQAAGEVELVRVGEGAVVDVDQRVVERARRGGDCRRGLADVGGDGRDHLRARAEQVRGEAAQVTCRR